MKRFIAVASATAALASLAACGSSASSSNSGSQSGPVTIVQIAPFDSQVTSLPFMQTSLQAGVDQINATGGLNGHQVKLVACNNAYDPNKELSCAQQAVRDKAIAVVGSLLMNGASTLKVLEQAKIPSLGADLITPSDGQSPASFLFDTGLVSYSAMPIVAKEKLGATKIVEFNNENPSVSTNNGFFDEGAKLAGVQVVGRITVPLDAVDYTQYVVQAEKDGAQAIVSAANPDANLKLWKAMATTGSKLKTVMSSDSASQEVVTQAGAIANGDWLVQGIPNASTDNPYGAAYVAAMKKYEPKETVLSGVGLRPYYAALLLQQVLKKAGNDPTSANVWDDLSKVSGMKFAWITDLDFTKPGPFASTPRVVSTNVFTQQITNGQIKGAGEVSVTG